MTTAHVKHKTSKHLSACKYYIPDYKVAFEYKQDKAVDIFIIKIKKEKRVYLPHASDKIKIQLEMQIMLINYSRDHDCLLYEMKLNYEAQYISRVVEDFHLPRDMNDICFVPRVASIFVNIKTAVDNMITKILERKDGQSQLLPYVRHGYKLPAKLMNKN